MHADRQTDRQTDKHVDTLIAILHTPTGAEVDRAKSEAKLVII